MWIVIGLSLLAILLGIDVYLATNNVPGDTWSQLLRRWGEGTPLIAWTCGVLMGHWFHPDSWKPLLGQPTSVMILIWFTVTLGIIGLGFRAIGHPLPSWMVLLPAFLAGGLFWPVR